MFSITRLCLIFGLLFLAACNSGGAATESAPPPSPTVPTAAVPASPTPSFTPAPTTSLAGAPTATTMVLDQVAAPVQTPEVPVTDLALAADRIFIHPVPAIYEGDTVSFQVLVQLPEIVDAGAVTVEVVVGNMLSLRRGLTSRTLAGEATARFDWVWETVGEAGEHQVTITVDPDDVIIAGDEDTANNQVTLTVPVLPARALPVREQGAEWITAETQCCVLHVVSGTAAHRDLNALQQMVEEAVGHAGARIGVTPQEPLHFYLVARVIGQGGYAGSATVISYLDRSYVGTGIYEVIVHEATHLLDQQFAPERIPFLAEGLAVWVTGGHYKQENVAQRVQALRTAGLYLPLRELIDDFYPHQHEIGYTQAGGFVSYLVGRYGWEEVKAFYSDVKGRGTTPLSTVLDEALQRHFGRTLADVERDWVLYLDALPDDPAATADVLATIRYYDTVRAYQEQFDPTAYFLQAWLPSPGEMEQRKITADLMRHPSTEVNDTLEVMLLAVDEAIRRADYGQATVILDSVERVLKSGGMFRDPLAMDYHAVVAKLTSVGYEVHRLELNGNQAVAHVTEGRRVYLRPVSLQLRARTWVLLN